MVKIQKHPGTLGLSILSAAIIISSIGASFWTTLIAQGKENSSILPSFKLGPIIIQKNSLLAVPTLTAPPVSIKTIPMVVTAYSSSLWETDDDPNITASGTLVRSGVVANNLLPFDTKVRIPKLYGDRIFIVEDRMNSRKDSYQLDIWFPSYWEAKKFGVKTLNVEILD